MSLSKVRKVDSLKVYVIRVVKVLRCRFCQQLVRRSPPGFDLLGCAGVFKALDRCLVSAFGAMLRDASQNLAV